MLAFNSQKAFTLLELVIVIIIISVLVSLALPRMYDLVDKTLVVEAISTISSIRAGMERCYLMNNGTYEGCRAGCAGDDPDDWAKLGMEDPSFSPGSHFRYYAIGGFGGGPASDNPTRYYIVAHKQIYDGSSWWFGPSELKFNIIMSHNLKFTPTSSGGLQGSPIDGIFWNSSDPEVRKFLPGGNN